MYVLQSSKVNAHGQRWVSELSEFNFTVKYRPGLMNKDANCLSRHPLDINKYTNLSIDKIDKDHFNAIMAGVTVQQDNNEVWVAGINARTRPTTKDEMLFDGEDKLSKTDIKNAQERDPVISVVRKVLVNGHVSLPLQSDTRNNVKQLLHQKKKLFLDDDGILKRRVNKMSQLVLPSEYIPLIYKHLHSEMGHLGPDKVFNLARQRVYWPRMYTEIEHYIQKKCSCIVSKKPHRNKVAPLQSILTSSPMELVCIDFLKLEKASEGFEYFLLIVDHFSRFAQAYPTKTKCALAAAKHLYGDFILRYCIPSRIMHDQGGEFVNKLFT